MNKSNLENIYIYKRQHLRVCVPRNATEHFNHSAKPGTNTQTANHSIAASHFTFLDVLNTFRKRINFDVIVRYKIK